MKRFLILLAFLVSSVALGACTKELKASDFSVSYEAETNPDYVGSYSAWRCNGTANGWKEWGEWTAFEDWNPLVPKFVGVGYLARCGGSLVLRTDANHRWEFEPGGGISKPGFRLVKK